MMLGELKNTFQEPEVLDRGSPRGLISAWSGGYFTNNANGGFTNILGNSVATANAYLNPLGWYVCDGAEVLEIDSPIFNVAGRHIPNITDDRFLMGGIVVGNIGGSNFLTDHTHAHTIAATQAAHTHLQDAHNHLQDSHNHLQDAHNHTQNFHTHTQDAHNHTQNSHNHIQDAHNHTQNSHNHIQDAHNHTLSDPGHRHQLESWYGVSGNGAQNPNNQGYGNAGPYGWSINSNYVGTGISLAAATATNQITTATNIATTATNQITTATNIATTAINQVTTATNIATTATNQITTATNIATTATNQSAQPIISVTGTVGSGSAATSTENRPKYLSCLYIIKVK